MMMKSRVRSFLWKRLRRGDYGVPFVYDDDFGQLPLYGVYEHRKVLSVSAITLPWMSDELLIYIASKSIDCNLLLTSYFFFIDFPSFSLYFLAF